MGGGILPATIHKGKLYFLFGKEGKYEDSAPGFSDFGGGTDNKESFLETAVREACEEFTGFLGNEADVRKMLKSSYNIDYHDPEGKFTPYRVHIFSFPYNEWLPYYYNNNQRFLQKRLDPKVMRTSKIFEKAEIKWVPVDHLKKMRPEFRCFFRHIADEIIENQTEIKRFLKQNGDTRKRSVKSYTCTRRR